MVTQNIDITKEPRFGELGKPTLPSSYNIGAKELHHLPDIPLEQLDNMFKQDGQISGLWRLITTPLRANDIQVRPKNSRSKREANFIEEILVSPSYSGGMRTNFQLVMSTVLRMLLDGWAPHEIVWRLDVDGFVRVDKIAYRSAKTLTVQTNKNGEIASYNQKRLFQFGSPSDEVVIPADKILHFTFGAEWNAVFGRSLFLQSFYHYEKKHKLYYISHIAAQLQALRMRVVRAPEGEAVNKIQSIVEAVAKLGFNSTITMPEGYELEIPDMGSGGTDLLPLIQHHDVQMSKAVLSQVLDVGVEGRTGSFNLSDTHLDIFITNLGLIAKNIASVLNEALIPRLIQWNFGTDNYPTVKFVAFDRDDKRFIAELFNRVASARTLNVSPEFMLEIEKQVADQIGIDINYLEVEDRMKQRIEKQLEDALSDDPEDDGTIDDEEFPSS